MSKVLNITNADFLQNPYITYGSLRKLGAVHFLPENNTWLVVDFEEIKQILDNPSLFSSEGENGFDPILLNCDPPKHTHHRKIITGDGAPFSSKRISKLETDNREIAQALLQPLLENTSIEVLSDFALPFSSLVILNLLGINTQNNAALKAWSQSVVANKPNSKSDFAEQKWEQLKPIVKQWINDANKNPEGEGLSEIIFHSFSQKNFTDEDTLNLVKVLLLGGNETTPNLISSALLILLNNSELLNEVRNNYDLIDAVINETLRLETPTQIIHRTTRENVTIGKKLIPKGSLVSLALGAANRDPKVFENPHKFDINSKERKILSFGFGPHYCLGAHLAKQEAQITLELLLKSFPDLRLDKQEHLVYKSSSFVRGLERLTIKLSENKFHKPISTVKKEAVELLKNSTLPNGEFPTYEYYPNTEELRPKGWHITAPSPFVHANVVLSLINLKNIGLESVIVKGTEFIQSQKEYGDVWRFWQFGSAANNVPPDADDTAICSAVLESVGKKLENRKLLEANIEANGVLKTWISPKLSDFFMRPRLSYKWWREKQYYQPTVDANLLNLNDFELGVMANTLLYLGENSITKPSVELCIDLWKDNKGTNHFYNNDMVIAYHIARAYKRGIASFEKLSADILERIEIRFNTLSFPELLLAGLCIKYFKLTTNMGNRIADRVKSSVVEEDFVFPHFGYFTSKDRNYVAGSPMLLVCWFLELSEEWDC